MSRLSAVLLAVVLPVLMCVAGGTSTLPPSVRWSAAGLALLVLLVAARGIPAPVPPAAESDA